MNKTFAFLLCCLLSVASYAQPAGEGLSLKGDGSYIVAGVILMIFAGIVLYLVRIDRKISRLENEEKNK